MIALLTDFRRCEFVKTPAIFYLLAQHHWLFAVITVTMVVGCFGVERLCLVVPKPASRWVAGKATIGEFKEPNGDLFADVGVCLFKQF